MAPQYSANSARYTVKERELWSPGWIARLPWLAFSALLGSMLCIAACVGILIASDGHSITAWRIQPTVWLAVLSTASSIMLHFGLSEGITVSWWLRAMRPQTQLDDLHRNWAFGNSLWAATTAGRQTNVIAIASILTALAPISNPLLQRASRVTVGTNMVSPVTLEVPIASAIPKSYTGYTSGRNHDVTLFNPNYTRTVQNYYKNIPFRLADKSGCQGDCRSTVLGVGLSVNCSSYTWPFTLETSSEQPYNASNDPVIVNGTNIFQSLFEWQVASGNMSLNIQYKDKAPCEGDLIVKNCTINTALVAYPIVIDNNNTISLDPSTTVFDDVVSHEIDIDFDSLAPGPSTLAGYYLALRNELNSEAHIRFGGAVGYELTTTGSTATQYAIADEDGDTNSCGLSFADPTMDLLAAARDLMFRTALSAGARNSSFIQSVPGMQSNAPAVYHSQYLYLGIAVMLTSLAVFFTTLTFVGYSTLGRSVSMSPLETAKAVEGRERRGTLQPWQG